MNRDFLSALRREARESPESGIVEVFNYGREREGLIPLWAGEGDLPTPDFIYQACVKSLEKGETFYTWQRGIPELRAWCRLRCIVSNNTTRTAPCPGPPRGLGSRSVSARISEGQDTPRDACKMPKM